MNIKRKKWWKQRILRYRKAVHGYALYVMMIALFLWVLPVVTLYFLGKNQYFFFFFIGIIVFTFFGLFYVTFTKKDILDKQAWFMLILFLPFFGAFVFWFIGLSQTRPKIYLQKSARDSAVLKRLNEQYTVTLPTDLSGMQQLAPHAQFTLANKQQLLTSQDVYDAMLTDINQAIHHIHLEMYILRYDKTTKPLIDALMHKAESGVQVRLLLDVFGTVMLSDKMIDKLIESGIELVFFNQQTRELLDHSHVNHRKNLIIDGKIAYTGGFNFGAEYVYGYPHKQLKWCDCMSRIEGNLVASIQIMFLLDWTFSLNLDLDDFLQDEAYVSQMKPLVYRGGAITQFITDGPDREGFPIKDTLRSLIHQAKERIYFTTPYLIPPEDVMNSLKLAALSGVDVRIIIPGVPDKKIVYYSTESHIEELLKVGVKIYKMPGFFVHSKLYLFDHETTVYGTANVDMRSFFLNLEENIVQYYDRAFNEQALTRFRSMLTQSEQLTYVTWRKRSFLQKSLEKIFNILHPLF